jgi:Phage tail tube protein
MAQVNSSTVAWAQSVETSLGVSSSTWKTIEPNPGTAKMSSNPKTVSRMPITADRQERPGQIVGLDPSFEYESDAVLDTFIDMLQDALCAVYKGGAVFSPTSVTTSAFVVPSGGALAQNTLIVAKGFVQPQNNGLFVVGAGSTGTSITVSGTVAETTTTVQNATVEVAGVRGASGDITLTVSGGVVTLGSTALDFTTLSLNVGQALWLGGTAGGSNAFATAADRGFARIKSIAAHAVVLDRTPGNWVTDTGTGKLIDIYFGRWIRPVARTSADFLARTHSFEGAYPSLGVGVDEYRYARGMALDQMEITIPLQGKNTVKYGYKGTDVPTPVTTRDSGAATPLSVVQNTLIASATDVMRLRLMDQAEVEYSIDNAWFTQAKLTIKNNAQAKPFVGALINGQISLGRFEAELQFTGLLTSEKVLAAVRNNTPVGMDFAMRSSDGAVYCDLPSTRLSAPSVDEKDNDLIEQQATATGVREISTYPYACSFSILPFCPAS